MKHINITVFGKVQNVGFRFNTKKQADNLGLKGFVQNKDDGSVYIEVEGNKDSLKSFQGWCKEGPAFSRVKRIEVEKGNLKNFEDFEITY